MTEYINDGGYGEPVLSCQFRFKPNEFKCPREFWSQESIFLDNLIKEIRRLEVAEIEFNRSHPDNRHPLEVICHPSRPTDWKSPAFGPLSVFRLCVSVRLNNSLYEDAEAAGLHSERDVINYYNNHKLE